MLRPCVQIVGSMQSTARWQQKYAACVLLRDLVVRAPQQSAAALPMFISPVRELMTDAREEVREAALASMQLALSLVGNRDLEPLSQVRIAWNLMCSISAEFSAMLCTVFGMRKVIR
jgi:hypothetical protein